MLKMRGIETYLLPKSGMVILIFCLVEERSRQRATRNLVNLQAY
jgi:hypothetical protein